MFKSLDATKSPVMDDSLCATINQRYAYTKCLTIFPLLTANSCIGVYSITNAASIRPTSYGKTGDSFDVSCNSGYFPSPEAGSMICDSSNNWVNIPVCTGGYPTVAIRCKINFLFMIELPILVLR